MNIRSVTMRVLGACILSLSLSQAASTQVMTYVENVENMTSLKVRYVGKPWSPHADGYLEGRGAGQQVSMIPAPAAGNFLVNAELMLPAKDKKSAITFGYNDKVILQSGSRAVILQGKFFRAGDRPIEVTGPEIPPGKSISLSLERNGETATLKIGGQEVYSGPCDPGNLDILGVDPMEGRVRLVSMGATGIFQEKEKNAFSNPFGMQLRVPPREVSDVFAPVIVREGPTNECSMVRRRDGALELYFATKPSSDSISFIRSEDGGQTWTEPAVAFPLRGKIYYAVMVAEGRDGVLHAAFHIFGEGAGGYRGRLYEIYHTSLSTDGVWGEPRRVIPGYVGSLRGFIELSSGRLVMAAGVAAPDRMDKPAKGTDYGWNDTVIYTSDDNGKNWARSPDVLQVPLVGENNTRYGAIEPALVQLSDGRVWMLIRDRGGRFWESFSEDGSRWSPAHRTDFITSDSPASFIKLKNGKIVLLANACQNWSDPRSYAMGGREVLQASISSDDGKTWSGFRDVLHETLGPSGGDRGTAYASGAETDEGKVCFFSGQGEGKRAIVLFDPKWLEEASVGDDLAVGPTMWTQYGDKGIGVKAANSIVLPLSSTGLSGASWNFPAARKGEIKLRIWIPEKTVAGSLTLTDHFSRMDDGKAAENGVFLLSLDEKMGLIAGQWNDVVISWAEAKAIARVNAGAQQTLGALRPTAHGLNYLRVEARSEKNSERIEISGLSAIRD